MGSNPIETAKDMTITAQDCCKQIDEALEMFGRYSYYDKGPTEVMFMNEIVDELNSMPATKVRDLLKKVMNHPHGERFVSAVMVMSQDRSDEDFEIMEQACPNGW